MSILEGPELRMRMPTDSAHSVPGLLLGAYVMCWLGWGLGWVGLGKRTRDVCLTFLHCVSSNESSYNPYASAHSVRLGAGVVGVGWTQGTGSNVTEPGAAQYPPTPLSPPLACSMLMAIGRIIVAMAGTQSIWDDFDEKVARTYDAFKNAVVIRDTRTEKETNISPSILLRKCRGW